MLLRFLLCALDLFLSVPSVCGTAEVTLSSKPSPRECTPPASADDAAAGCAPSAARVDVPETEECTVKAGKPECSDTAKKVQKNQLPEDRRTNDCTTTDDEAECTKTVKEVTDEQISGVRVSHGDVLHNSVSELERGRGRTETHVTEQTVDLKGTKTEAVKREATPTPPPPGNGSHRDSTSERTELPAQSQPAG
ncbi:uncharacterized protein TM35_000102990, partial [Trypanosoma theileri]